MSDDDPPAGGPPPGPSPDPLPFPDSQCHACSAPPRYVRTATSVFILCPRLAVKYPRQPVKECPAFTPRR